MKPAGRALRRSLALLALAAGGAGAALAAARPLGTAIDARLVPAADGNQLVAGGRARLSWAGALPAGESFEEWEAFLSYDGGRTWPVRLTPHLDLARRDVEVVLPPVASADARLLLRFGDERDEREAEAPGAFAIAATATNPLAAEPALARRAGESARPGVAGVVWWVDGDRDGSRSVRREALPRGFAAGAPSVHDFAADAAAGDAATPPQLLPPAASGRELLVAPAAPSAGTAPAPGLPTGRRLALLSRRNE